MIGQWGMMPAAKSPPRRPASTTATTATAATGNFLPVGGCVGGEGCGGCGRALCVSGMGIVADVGGGGVTIGAGVFDGGAGRGEGTRGGNADSESPSSSSASEPGMPERRLPG